MAQRNPFKSPVKKKEPIVSKKVQKPEPKPSKKKIEKPRVIGQVFSQNKTWLVKGFQGRIWIESQKK